MISALDQVGHKPFDLPVERRLSPWIAAIITSVVFASFLAYWLSYDNRVPATDEAGHILNSLSFTDLFHHARPFRAAWWTQLLTVNPFYPPFVYAFAGAMKLLFGTSILVDKACLIIFDVALTLSTFASARVLTRSNLAAVIAACCINVYPQNVCMSHLFMLDFPLTAMVSLAFFALVWWQQAPSWPRAAFAMVALASACLTKQIAVGFLLLPGIWCLIHAVRDDRRARSLNRSVQVFGMATAVLLTAVPWIVTNYQWIHKYAAENAVNMGGLGTKLSPLHTFADYVVGLYHSMSPLMTAVLLLAALKLSPNQHRRLVVLYLLAVGGLIAISSLTFTFPLDRYASSVLIACAVVTGYGVAAWYESFPKSTIIAGVVTAAAVCLQLVSFCFCPTPLADSALLLEVAPRMGVFLREFRGVHIERSTPAVNGYGWGQQWVIDTISQVDPGSPVWLNILPSQGVYNPHSFELLVKQKHASLKPTTSRSWTIMGDSVDFSPEKAMWYQWYLITNGDQGNKLRDASSEENYRKLISFVQTSGKFEVRGSKKLPDGSMLYLYRQK